jgi:hypothetical protein
MRLYNLFLINFGIIIIILSLLIIMTGFASWLSYFNLLLGLISINLGLFERSYSRSYRVSKPRRTSKRSSTYKRSSSRRSPTRRWRW